MYGVLTIWMCFFVSFWINALLPRLWVMTTWTVCFDRSNNRALFYMRPIYKLSVDSEESTVKFWKYLEQSLQCLEFVSTFLYNPASCIYFLLHWFFVDFFTLVFNFNANHPNYFIIIFSDKLRLVEDLRAREELDFAVVRNKAWKK